MTAFGLADAVDLDAALVPATPAETAAMRAAARDLHYPRNRLVALLADLADLDRDIARVGFAGVRAGARGELLARLDAERDKAAEAFLGLFALALDRRRAETLGLLVPVLAKLFGRTWDALHERLETLEAVVADLAAAEKSR